ncbi:MAG: adenosylmethionine--8-amino-7-oxononanoate transaminase [Deltaproteobacteria bacterium]|nr:adenosylmethionine--8-amino-7-oxononanoate transaminase [Deltaproteobacteria bacterium]
MSLWGAEDPVLVIDRAEGFHLVDTDGNRYLDGVSSLWCNVHGHRVPELDDAARAQLNRVAHSTLLGLSQTEAILLAKELVDVAPRGLTRVFFSDAGATAVEVALKMAAQYQVQVGRPEKRRFLALAEAYHGDTVGALSLGYSDWFHRAFAHLKFDVVTAPAPHAYRDPRRLPPEEFAADAAERVSRLIATHADTLAAVVMEPLVQGAAGMLVHPPGYLAAVARACRAHEVLLVCDEVATGFGRTGTMFACEQEGVVPDILCAAKGLSGGYLPVAATLTTERVFGAFLGAFHEGKTFFHGHTFTGNALGCAVSRASLRLLRERVLPALPARVQHLHRLLEPLRALRHVGDLRQRGLMVGMELVRDRATREPFPMADRVGHRVCMAARRHGVILRPLGNVVVLMPAPGMPEALLDTLVTAAHAAIVAITEAA